MNPRQIFEHLTGADIVAGQVRHENDVISEHTGHEGPHLPVDGGLSIGIQLYRERLVSVGINLGRVFGFGIVSRYIAGRHDQEPPAVL